MSLQLNEQRFGENSCSPSPPPTAINPAPTTTTTATECVGIVQNQDELRAPSPNPTEEQIGQRTTQSGADFVRDGGKRPTRSVVGPGEDSFLEQKPETRRRNKRLFGSLVHTLQKFKQEEDRTQASDVGQRRAAIFQRTEEHRQVSRQEIQNHAGNRRDVALDMVWGEGGQRERSFYRTVSEPSILWCPREPSTEEFNVLHS